MFCDKCGQELPEGSQFCDKCGNKVGRKTDFADNAKAVASDMGDMLQSGMSIMKEQAENYQTKRKEELEREKINKVEDVFVDSSEKMVAVLGGGYLNNFIHGNGLRKGFGILSNKRFYFRGKCYHKVNSHYTKSNEERVVDLQDITSSGFVFSKNIILKIWAIVASLFDVFCLFGGITAGEYDSDMWATLFFIGLAAVVVLWLIYFITKKCIYDISFAGGSIAVRASKYGIKETRKFDKMLRKEKDKAIGR